MPSITIIVFNSANYLIPQPRLQPEDEVWSKSGTGIALTIPPLLGAGCTVLDLAPYAILALLAL